MAEQALEDVRIKMLADVQSHQAAADEAKAQAAQQLQEAQKVAEERIEKCRMEGEAAIELVKDDAAAKLQAAEAALLSSRETAQQALEECRQAGEVAMQKAVESCRQEMEAQLTEATNKYAEEATKRRKIHNKLMEIQGNIRVFCRVRPQNEMESKQGDDMAAICCTFPIGDDIIVEQSAELSHRFEFDRCFKPDSKQEEVYLEVDGTITSCMDGYDVCIFAYGQTGSGKTYTMAGPPDNPGVNYRAIDRLFALQKERAATFSYKVELSMLEVAPCRAP